MGRITRIEHQGKPILLLDFSGLRDGEEFTRVVAEAKAYIASQPPSSVRSLFDATGAVYNAAVMAELKSFTAHNKPYVKASAVVGVEGILSIALMAVSKFSRRSFHLCKDRASALDWLAAQP